MNKHLHCLSLCIALLCLSVPVASQVQETSTQTAIRFVAVNKDGAFASTLAKDDIRATEDGIPQTVVALERQPNCDVEFDGNLGCGFGDVRRGIQTVSLKRQSQRLISKT